jgi:hypothetical protein
VQRDPAPPLTSTAAMAAGDERRVARHREAFCCWGRGLAAGHGALEQEEHSDEEEGPRRLEPKQRRRLFPAGGATCVVSSSCYGWATVCLAASLAVGVVVVLMAREVPSGQVLHTGAAGKGGVPPAPPAPVLQVDECGVRGGDNSECTDCAGLMEPATGAFCAAADRPDRFVADAAAHNSSGLLICPAELVLQFAQRGPNRKDACGTCDSNSSNE